MNIISPLPDETQNPWERFISYMTPPVSPIPGRTQGALGQAMNSFAEAKKLQAGSLLRSMANWFSGGKVSQQNQLPIPSPTPTYAPTPTMTPTQAPVPTVTPYPTPMLSPNQIAWGNELEQASTPSGVLSGLSKSIGFNESSLNPYPTPNITAKEQTYGPAGINILAHPNITQAQAEDPQFAKNFMVKRLMDANSFFPGNVERQILYYNVPGNAYKDPNDIPYEAAWYLQNALRTMKKIPSAEYLPVLQKYGFFK